MKKIISLQLSQLENIALTIKPPLSSACREQFTRCVRRWYSEIANLTPHGTISVLDVVYEGVHRISMMVGSRECFRYVPSEQSAYAYIQQLRYSTMIDGTKQRSDGTVEKGWFGYVPNLHDMALLEGEKTDSNNQRQVGTYVYSHMNEMRLSTIPYDNGLKELQELMDKVDQMPPKSRARSIYS